MKFKQLIDDTTWEQIEEALIRIYNVTPHNMEGYMSVVQKLSNMTPKESDMRICIDWTPPDGFNETGYWDIHGRDGTLHKDTDDAKLFPKAEEDWLNSEVTWGLEFNKWEEWIGMEIDSNTANNIELRRADIVAHILYEMTFVGYDEEEIQDKADELKERVEEVKNMSEEELKENCFTMEEFKEKMKKIIDEKEKESDNEEEED